MTKHSLQRFMVSVDGAAEILFLRADDRGFIDPACLRFARKRLVEEMLRSSNPRPIDWTTFRIEPH